MQIERERGRNIPKRTMTRKRTTKQRKGQRQERERESKKDRQRDADTEKVWGLLYESFGRKPG